MYDLSVILSTRNRERLLDQTLGGLSGQTIDGLNWEIVVVDNGSTDGTQDVLRRWKDLLPLITLMEGIPGKCRALNRALNVARGNLLVFTDDDIIPDRHWIRELWAGAARWPHDAVFCGTIIPRFPAAAPDFLMADDFRYREMAYVRYVPKSTEGPVSAIPFGPNWAVRRQALGDQLFDERLGPSAGDYVMGDETDLLMRLASAGNRYVYLPAAVVEHVIEPHQLTLKWLLRRAVRNARGMVRVGLGGDADFAGPEWFSVPRCYFRKLVEQIAALGLACFRGKKRRWEAAIDVWAMMGTIVEQRTMTREADTSKSARRDVIESQTG